MNIRTVQIDREPWLTAIDVCRALGLPTEGGAGKYLRRLDDADRQTAELLTPAWIGGKGPAVLVAESGLYKLIMRSDKQEAVVFQHWIASEVLPTTRKTGKYALPDHGRETMPLPMDIAEAVASNKLPPLGKDTLRPPSRNLRIS